MKPFGCTSSAIKKLYYITSNHIKCNDCQDHEDPNRKKHNFGNIFKFSMAIAKTDNMSLQKAKLDQEANNCFQSFKTNLEVQI